MATFVNEMLFDTKQAKCRAAKTMICDAQPTKPQRDMLPMLQDLDNGLLTKLKGFNFVRFVEIVFDAWDTVYTTCGSNYVEVPKFVGSKGDNGAASRVAAGSSVATAIAVFALFGGRR